MVEVWVLLPPSLLAGLIFWSSLQLPVSAPEELSSPDGSQSASFYLGAECWTPAETDWDPEDRSPSPAGSHPGFRPPEGPTPAPSVGGPARSRAAQEIMDICAVDQVGCEDSDLDEDTAAHILQELEQEHRRMSWSQVSPTDGRACEGLALSSSHGDQRGRGHSPQSRNQKEQKDEAAETDVRVPSLS